jgi:phage regulator Rha-like protein
MQTDFPFEIGETFSVFNEGGQTYITYPRPHPPAKCSDSIMCLAAQLFPVHDIPKKERPEMNELIPVVANQPLTMTSLEIAELVGARHDSVKRTIERLAESGVIALPPLVEKPDTGGRPGTYYVFDLAHKRDSFVVVAQLSPEFTAALVDRWQELEDDVKKNAIVLPGNYLAALKALTVEVEKREEAEARALEAERTKALIGSKREAQAMATASRESRRADALAAKLDESRKYASVKRMEKAYHRKFKWQPLKRLSEALGYHVKKAEDQNYGEVNTYHADIWLQAYALEIPA